MSLLERPEAQALLAAADVRGCRDPITRFLKRYLPSSYRHEQRGHAAAFVRGPLSGLPRKSVEPIASQAGVPRKDLQYFVGCGGRDDDKVMAEVRRHVRDELAENDGVIVLDPGAFPKKGAHSCGVARQWCGRPGKEEDCQLGASLAYVSAQGHAPLDRRLSLPKHWVDDPAGREACHVPEEMTDRKAWESAHDLLRRSGPDVPHKWAVGDDELGRASASRECLRTDRERSILDVPCNTTVRDLDGRRPPRKKGKRGAEREVPFVRVDTWARKLPADRWIRLTVRDGAKGPLEVEAVSARVCAGLGRRIGPAERLLVIRTVGPRPDRTYCLSNAPPDEPLAELVRVRSCRHRIEEVFPRAQGEAGLAHDEVRSWVGRHHHVTLALLALWFLVLERGRIGGESPGGDGGADAGALHRVAPQASPDGAGDRRGGQSGLAA